VTDRLPIFPLATVLFPGLVLPLNVFEPRYRRLVEDLLAVPEAERQLGVVAIREGREVGTDGVRALYPVGCVAAVREVEAHPDGRFGLVTAGIRRFRLGELDHSRPYLQAAVQLLDEPDGDAPEVPARTVARLFTAYHARLTGATEPVQLLDEPSGLSYLVAAAAVLDLADRQALLEAPDTAARLRREVALLRRETAMLRLLPSLPAVDLPRAGTSPN
jgi:Lon protease-like protein